MGGALSRNGDKRYPYRNLVGRPESKRPLARPRPRCENNIKIGIKYTGCEDADHIYLVHETAQWHATLQVQ
jgi:hypothetical protein